VIVEIPSRFGYQASGVESPGMTHRHARRLAGFLGRALLAYGLLMVLMAWVLVLGLVYVALFHEPPPD